MSSINNFFSSINPLNWQIAGQQNLPNSNVGATPSSSEVATAESQPLSESERCVEQLCGDTWEVLENTDTTPSSSSGVGVKSEPLSEKSVELLPVESAACIPLNILNSSGLARMQEKEISNSEELVIAEDDIAISNTPPTVVDAVVSDVLATTADVVAPDGVFAAARTASIETLSTVSSFAQKGSSWIVCKDSHIFHPSVSKDMTPKEKDIFWQGQQNYGFGLRLDGCWPNEPLTGTDIHYNVADKKVMLFTKWVKAINFGDCPGGIGEDYIFEPVRSVLNLLIRKLRLPIDPQTFLEMLVKAGGCSEGVTGKHVIESFRLLLDFLHRKLGVSKDSQVLLCTSADDQPSDYWFKDRRVYCTSGSFRKGFKS